MHAATKIVIITERSILDGVAALLDEHVSLMIGQGRCVPTV